MRVAICQTVTLDGDYEGNVTRIENALCEATRSGADLACFPEAAVFGWVNPEAHERASPVPGAISRRLGTLADTYDVMLSVGVAEKEEADLYNSCLLFDADGDLLLKHRKTNVVPDLMTPPYAPGKEVSTVETAYGTVGALICADTFESEILDRLAEQKPDLVLVPYGWAAPEDEWPSHGTSLEQTVVETAASVGAVVVGTDSVGRISNGPWSGRVFGGQSLVADRDGDVIATLRDRDREVRTVDVDL